MKFYKLINLNKFSSLELDAGGLLVDDLRYDITEKPNAGEKYIEHNGSVARATAVQLSQSVSSQQTSLRQRQDQLAKEKESKKAVLLDTPPATGRTGAKKPPQPRPSALPTPSPAATAAPTPATATPTATPSTHPDKLVHLKTRLIQLLALKSVEASEATGKLQANPQDIHYLLNQVAYSQKSMQASTPIYHLKHELWDDVEVDNWRQYSDAEKQQVAAAVKRKTGKISQCIANTAKENEKTSSTTTSKKAAPGKTRQNLLRASQGKKISRSPSPAKAMLNAKDASGTKEKEKEKEKEKDKEQASTSSRSPSVLSTHSSSNLSKESNGKRKRETDATSETLKKSASTQSAKESKESTTKRLKKGKWELLRGYIY